MHALAACGQRESSATDPFELLQQGEFFAAVEACDLRLMIAGRGTEARHELLLARTEALSAAWPAKAAEEFLELASNEPGLFSAEDYRYLVIRFLARDHIEPAYDLLYESQSLWPEEAGLRDQFEVVIEQLREDPRYRAWAWPTMGNYCF